MTFALVPLAPLTMFSLVRHMKHHYRIPPSKKDENYLTKKILALEKSQRSGHVCYPKITTSNGMSYGKRTSSKRC